MRTRNIRSAEENQLDITKSQLGKLLAAENIRVEHRKVKSAFFDLQDRTLVLPIWRDMDADLYDLLLGHETGHALFTPREGWIAKAKEGGEKFQCFLNIVEDARIEKKMKRKFPGLKRPMWNGYKQLVERGFFGLKFEEMNAMPLIDRINCHFKAGARANITFTSAEQNIVDRIEAAETFDEVVLLAQELFALAGEERDALTDIFEQFKFDAESEGLRDALDDMMQSRGDKNSGDKESGNKESGNNESGNENKKPEMGQEHQTSALGSVGGGGGGSEIMTQAAAKKLSEALDKPLDYSLTDAMMQEKNDTLIDPDAYPYVYVNLPKIDTKKFVIPSKIVHSCMALGPEWNTKKTDLYREFMSANKNYIGYLVKEFELRRNAKQFQKAKVSKTGDLDMDKVWKYQLSEDLFLQSMIVPNGKSHAMIMIMDLSGSMCENMKGSLEQIVAMAMFCRRVNIPFDVYGFNDNGCIAELIAAGIWPESSKQMQANYGATESYRAYEELSQKRNDNRPGSLYINDPSFRLQQLLHYRMSLQEFNEAVRNLLLIAETFDYRNRNYYTNSIPSIPLTPPNMQLGGTPLNEAIIVMTRVAAQFKKDTKVEILTSMILTDGDGSFGFTIVGDNNTTSALPNGSRMIIQDEETRESVTMNHGNYYCRGGTQELLTLYKKISGSRVLGFYLMSGRNYKSQIQHKYNQYTGLDLYAENNEFAAQYAAEFNKHKYFGVKCPGYDTYFMVPGSDLEIESLDMDDFLTPEKYPTDSQTGIVSPTRPEPSKHKLYSAFKKLQNSKSISRVFLNQFIKLVS